MRICIGREWCGGTNRVRITRTHSGRARACLGARVRSPIRRPLGLEVERCQEIAKEVGSPRRAQGSRSQQAAQQESVEDTTLFERALFLYKRTPETWKNNHYFQQQSLRLPRRLERMRVWRRAYAFLSAYTINRTENMPKSAAQNRQFVSTPTVGSAHRSGPVVQNYDWTGNLRRYRRAIELNPNDANWPPLVR